MYGAYHITVNWTIDENEYFAEMTLNLNKKETLAAGEFYSYFYDWEREQGFLKKFSRHEEFEQIDNIYIYLTIIRGLIAKTMMLYGQ